MKHLRSSVLRFSPEGEVLGRADEWKKLSSSMYRRVDWENAVTWYYHTTVGIPGVVVQPADLPAAIKVTCLLLNLPLC